MKFFINIKKKIQNFNLDITLDTETDFLGILGASGSGKSMTLRCISGLEKPDSGKIIINNKTIFDSERNINLPCKKRNLGFLFQNYGLFPNMSVEQNINIVLKGINKSEKMKKINNLLALVKLSKFMNKYPHQLSGGQQQRLALVRALATEPDILLLDEPFSAMDEHLKSYITKELLELVSFYKISTVFVTHNIEEAYRLCDKLIILNNGKINSMQNKKILFEKPLTIEAAKLTGCKNFSLAKYVNHNEFEAKDWNINLLSNTIQDKKLKYVGIRANYIRLAANNNKTNTLFCWPSFINESPFRVTIYLSIGKKPSNSKDFQLQWELTKEKWYKLKNKPAPWKIYLEPEKLITILNTSE